VHLTLKTLLLPFAGLAAAFALSGCIATNGLAFSPWGDKVQLASAEVCNYFNDSGKPTGSVEHYRVKELKSDGGYQYLTLQLPHTWATHSTPMTISFHKISGDLYVGQAENAGDAQYFWFNSKTSTYITSESRATGKELKKLIDRFGVTTDDQEQKYFVTLKGATPNIDAVLLTLGLSAKGAGFTCAPK
jgi:hypothetical protein